MSQRNTLLKRRIAYSTLLSIIFLEEEKKKQYSLRYYDAERLNMHCIRYSQDSLTLRI